MPMDSAASAAMNITFRGAISGAFEGHLQSYVDLEKRQMLDGIERGTKTETWGSADYEAGGGGGDGAQAGTGASDSGAPSGSKSTSSSNAGPTNTTNKSEKILISSGDMFMNIKKVFKRCANLARGQTLFDMFIAFQAVLETYAFKLNERAERAASAIANPRNSEQVKMNEIKVLVLIVNTAEYCAETILPLAESTRRALDPSFREKIDGSSSEDAFQSCIAKTLNTLVRSVTLKTGVSTEVLRVNWGTIETVGDHSKFVETCATTFLNASKIVRANASSENHFRFFCEKLAASVSRELRATLLRVKKFSMVGCQQALLDSNDQIATPRNPSGRLRRIRRILVCVVLNERNQLRALLPSNRRTRILPHRRRAQMRPQPGRLHRGIPPRHGPESHPKRIHAHLRSQRHAQSRHRAIRRTVRPARHHRRRRYFRRSICRWSGDGGKFRKRPRRDLRQRSNSNLKNLMQKMSADMSGMFTVKK